MPHVQLRSDEGTVSVAWVSITLRSTPSEKVNAVVLDFMTYAPWFSGTQWVARGAVLSGWMVPPFT